MGDFQPAACHVKSERYFEFDLARFLAMMGMPFFHTMFIALMFGVTELDAFAVNKALGLIRLFGPPVFMTALGANIVFSAHSTPKNLLARALVVFAAAMLLNVVRYLIPAFAGQILTGDPSMMEAALFGMVTSDILFLATLVFLAFALLIKLKIKPFGVLAVSAALVIVSELVTVDPTGNHFLDLILANFVHIKGATSAVYFMGWFVYPALGYVLGSVLTKKNPEERRTFYRRAGVISAAFFVALSVCMILCGMDYMTVLNAELNDYDISVFSVLLNVSIVLMTLSICYFAVYGIKSQKILEIIIAGSKRLFAYYMLQWVFVMAAALGCVAVVGMNPVPLWVHMLCAFGALALSLILSKPIQRAYLRLMERIRK